MGCTGNVCKGSHMMQWDVNEDNFMKYITNLRTDAEKFLKDSQFITEDKAQNL